MYRPNLLAGSFLIVLGTLAPANAAEPLGLFKNYFLTGDYIVGGIGLQGKGQNGLATGTILIDKVPAQADILGAFLYWATVEHTTGSGAVGARFGYPDPKLSNPNLALNDISQMAVRLGSGTPPCWSGGGATGGGGGSILLAQYRVDVLRFLQRDPNTGKRWVNRGHTVMLADSGSGNSTPSTLGASLVIVYRDSPSFGDTKLPLKAIVIYDGSYTMNQSTQSMTQTIEGFYQASTTEFDAKLTHIVSGGQANFPEQVLFNGKVIASDVLNGAQGAAWDNWTYNVSGKVGTEASVTTAVNHAGSGSFDCLAWGAVIFSTVVEDTDKDGLLDVWESKGFRDVSTGLPVDLPGMGADPHVKDLFIQVDYMTDGAGHSHLPSKDVLDKVAKAYRDSPVENGKYGTGIRVHFGVGKKYQTTPPDPAIIPGSFNIGGNEIPESSTCSAPKCVFPQGTVGWKTGYQFIRDQHFPYGLKDVFHYALFAHALGTKAALGTGIPPSISGVADLLGSDLMVTLGKWDKQVGTEFAQAATLFHELGHNVGLRHAPTPAAPNCQPNFLSSMNYLYQMGGLLDAKGIPNINYSSKPLPDLTEGNLSDVTGLGTDTLPYQARWYVPHHLSILHNALGTSPATRHCDGTPKTPADTTTDMIKVDSGTLSGRVDWKLNNLKETGFAQDLDYNGNVNGPVFKGFDDWSQVDLQQIGGRRNVIGLSLAIQKDDLAAGDSGLGDSGLGGLGDSGLGDSGLGDSGLGDSGLGDSGLGVELDYETASTGNAPNSLSATAGKQSITLNWSAPNVSSAMKYGVYRAIGIISATNLPVLLQYVTGEPPPTTFVDTNVKNNVQYSYLVVMTDLSNNQSGPSNIVTITK